MHKTTSAHLSISTVLSHLTICRIRQKKDRSNPIFFVRSPSAGITVITTQTSWQVTSNPPWPTARLPHVDGEDLLCKCLGIFLGILKCLADPFSPKILSDLLANMLVVAIARARCVADASSVATASPRAATASSLAVRRASTMPLRLSSRPQRLPQLLWRLRPLCLL